MDMESAKTKPELPRDKWLRNGYRILADKGPDGLTIDLLCQGTGLTKGSFYHHFGDRESYIEALLAQWEEKSTLEIIERAEEETGPREKLRMLTRLSFSDLDVVIERRIRAWSLLDERVHQFQERVDQRRQEYMTELWNEILGDEERARSSARLMFAIFIGGQTILPAATEKEYKKWYAQLEQLWIG